MKTQNTSLKRFTDAQQESYKTALAEIKNGRKQSHWMWYIFPQIQGLGFSETSKYYAVKNLKEAGEYLQHPVLGKRLIEICNTLLKLPKHDASHIFGSPDDMKLRSSMTLFTEVENADPVFNEILNTFFKGERDQNTLRILRENK